MAISPLKKCALTGAGGFVGSRLKAYLRGQGWEVLEWRRTPQAGSASVSFQLGQDLAPEKLYGMDALVHCAYDFTCTQARDIHARNVIGSEKLLRAAHAAGVPRLVFISTISAFEGCRSLYGQAKLRVEAVARELDGYVIRPGLVYDDSPGGVFGKLVDQVRNSRVVPVFRGGAQTQYLVHEADLGAAVLRCLTGEIPGGDPPITVAHGHGRELQDILREIARVLGKRVTFAPLPWRLVWIGLRSLEICRLPAPFRSDSLISMVFQDPSPDFDRAEALGLRCRPFAVTQAMVSLREV